MDDARIRAKLERVREGIATGLGLKSSKIDILFREHKVTADDPLAQFGYFGVFLHRGARREKKVMLSFSRGLTVARMIRAIVELPSSSWRTKGESNKPRPL